MSVHQRAHSKYSASGSERWLNCAASVALEEQSPPSKDSVWSKEGTEAHAVLETLFKIHQLKAFEETAEMLGEVLSDADAPAMIRHGMSMVNYVLAIKDNTFDAELLTEARVYNGEIHPEMFGTVDNALIELQGTLHVFDYKYGQSKVDAKENKQMIQYALGLAEKYDWQFSDVVLHICQPRAGGNSSWALSIDKLKTYRELWRKGVARVEANKSKPFPGGHCHWCRAKAICPAKVQVREEKNNSMFKDLTTDEETYGAKNKKENSEENEIQSEGDWRKEKSGKSKPREQYGKSKSGAERANRKTKKQESETESF